MSSRFMCRFALALLVAMFSRSVAAEMMSIDEFLAAGDDSRATIEKPSDANPFADIDVEATPSIDANATRADWVAAAPVLPGPTVELVVNGDRKTKYRLSLPPGATVSSMLQTFGHQRFIDFSKASVVIQRRRQRVNDDLSINVEQRILNVEWDKENGAPTEATNHRLEPGDQLAINVRSGMLPQQPPLPVPAAYTPHHQPTYSAPPAVAPQPYTPAAPQAVVYSAIPVPMASPFDAPAIYPQPAPVAELPLAAVMEVAPFAPPRVAPATVKFEIVVVEDLDNSFAEFDQLQSRMPCMLTDTATIQGTLRILQKHKLVRPISSPNLVALCGRPATLQVGGESSDPEQPWQGFKTTISARELDGGLIVEFAFKNTEGRRTQEVQTSLIVPEGQTVVMKTGERILRASHDEEAAEDKVKPAVYVVLTPEIVRK